MDENICCNSDGSPTIYSFSDVFQLIKSISTKLEDFQKEKIKTMDQVVSKMTVPQIMILRHLWKNEQAPFKVLKNVCACPPSTVSGIVDTMVKDGLVIRQEDVNDRRNKIVIITNNGVSLQDNVEPLEISLNTCCTGFSEDELIQLSNLLKKLDGILRENEKMEK